MKTNPLCYESLDTIRERERRQRVRKERTITVLLTLVLAVLVWVAFFCKIGGDL